MNSTDTTTIERGRCNCKALFRLADLTILEEHRDRRTPYVQAEGECPKCGAYWSPTVTRSHGPEWSLTIVGIKAVKIATTPCRASCTNSKSLECKCSCGGENHGR